MSQAFLPITNYPTVNGLALDYFTPGPTQAPDEIRGDTQVSFSIEPVIENAPGVGNAFSPDFDSSDTFSMGIGNFDTPPTGGTMSLTANGSSTGLTAITYNQSAATLQTALNAAITAGGGGSATALCNVTLVTAGVYLIVGSTNQAVSTGFFGVTSAALLTPISTATFYEETLGSASTPYRILLVVVQAAMCYAEATTALADPDASLSVVQAGSGTTNRIQNLSFTPGAYQAAVTISATVNSVVATCGTITLGMSVTQVGSVLAQHDEIEYNNTDGTTANNISITPIDNGWNFEFIGTLGNSSANTLSLIVQNVSGPMGKSGVIDYNTVALLLYSYTQTGDSFTLKRQIVRTRSDGEVRTIYIADVTIDKSLLNPSTAVPTPVASYYTKTESNARFVIYSTTQTLTGSQAGQAVDNLSPAGGAISLNGFVLRSNTSYTGINWRNSSDLTLAKIGFNADHGAPDHGFIGIFGHYGITMGPQDASTAGFFIQLTSNNGAGGGGGVGILRTRLVDSMTTTSNSQFLLYSTRWWDGVDADNYAGSTHYTTVDTSGNVFARIDRDLANGAATNKLGFYLDHKTVKTVIYEQIDGFVSLFMLPTATAITDNNHVLASDGTALYVNAPSANTINFSTANTVRIIMGTGDFKPALTMDLGTSGNPWANLFSGTHTFTDATNIVVGTSTGTKIATATGQKLGFWNATPVVQQVLATGAAHTVDDVITLLQTLGLCKQS